jgi:aminoglycoside phosphotransferase (APT) family kinase protein
MSPPKMHADEIGVDRSLVVKLIATQFPHWSDLEIQPARSAGTDNAIFRLGDHMGIRLPKIHWAVHQVDTEFRLLARLAPELPVQLPLPVAKGVPAMSYPYPWLVYEWLDGEDLEKGDTFDPVQLALDLAGFVAALRQIDIEDAPEYRRPLSGEETATRKALAAIAGSFDTGRLAELWTEAVDADPWNGPPVWLHGDLLPGNILLSDGRLRGVIDWSATGAGDPARDLMIAWALPPVARDVYRGALSPDDATWTRARGWVITQCAQYIPYYAETIPVAVDAAKRRLQAVLDET